MELRRYLSVLVRRWPILVVTVLIAAAAAYATTPKTKYYTAHSTIVVGPRQYSTQNTGNGDLISGDQAVGVGLLIVTYSKLVATLPIATTAVEQTKAPRAAASVAGETKATPIANTQLLDISVTDVNPAVAQVLATGMANAFVAKVNSFQPDQPAGVGTVPAVPVYVFADAQFPGAPGSTGLTSNMIVGGIFGLLAAAAVIALLEYLDLTLKDPQDAERRVGLPVLGVIPLAADSGPALSPAMREERVAVVEQRHG